MNSESAHAITGWLVSSAGRRGELVRILQSTAVGNGPVPVCAVDITAYSAAGMLADSFELVPRCTQPDFVERVMQIARRHRANVVIPTIDPEIAVYARAREELRQAGVLVWVSSPEVAQLGWDKWELAQWCERHQLPGPRTVQVRDRELALQVFDGPVIAKPRSGSASIGVRRYQRVEAVEFTSLTDDYILQECVPGAEVTIDFAVSRAGELLGYCPRKRLEVRAGEVSKAVTITHPAIDALMAQVVPLLPGAYGMLNLQVFLDETTGKVTILELNPRFGGGFPLAHAAGSGLLEALVADTVAPGSAAAGRVREGEPGLVMLRYDSHVVTREEDLPGACS